MIGEIKKVELDRKIIYKKDDKGNYTKEIEKEIPGTFYELKKQGVNFSLTVQSIFYELILKNGLDIPDDQIEGAMACGMRGQILDDIEDVIKKGVFSPKIIDYDEIPLKHIPKLLFQIYMFQVGNAEKKSETPIESVNTQAETPKSEGEKPSN